MPRFRLTLMALVGAWVLGDVADGAAPIVTPALSSAGADSVSCTVINAGTQPADVTIDIVHSFAGTVQETDTQTVQPGRGHLVVDVTPVPSYCRVTGISAKKARVSFCMRRAVDDECIGLVTSP